MGSKTSTSELVRLAGAERLSGHDLREAGADQSVLQICAHGDVQWCKQFYENT